MLNRYSHIRMSTKKAAVDALAGVRVVPEPQAKPKPKPVPEKLEFVHQVEPDALDVLRGTMGD